MDPKAARLLACPDCDLLQAIKPLSPGVAARCARCGHVLVRAAARTVERTCALALAALILLVLANVFPFLTLQVSGGLISTTILTGVGTLWTQGMPGLAVLVAVTAFLAPAAHIVLLLYLMFPLGFGRRPPGALVVFRWLRHIRPWSMAEVFLLGVLVSLVKLADLAEIVPGRALWAFALLIPVLTATLVTLDSHAIWDILSPPASLDPLDPEPPEALDPTAPLEPEGAP